MFHTVRELVGPASLERSKNHLPVARDISRVQKYLFHKVGTSLIRKLLPFHKLLVLSPLTNLSERNSRNLSCSRLGTTPRQTLEVVDHLITVRVVFHKVVRYDEPVVLGANEVHRAFEHLDNFLCCYDCRTLSRTSIPLPQPFHLPFCNEKSHLFWGRVAFPGRERVRARKEIASRHQDNMRYRACQA